MSLQTDVLRALFRLARRRRRPVTMNDLLARVAARPSDVRSAVDALVRAELVVLAPSGPQLSLAGLAVAVASAAVRAERARVARIVPLERRSRRSDGRKVA